jgi:hypothetical protein
MIKIAFLFLIYDIINHEELWNTFFSNIDPNKYSIYIHYKNNVPLKYFEKYKLDKCIPTKYCHVSIIHAHNLLMENALKDPDNYKFINVSQACIPLKPFDHIYNFLTSNDMAYFGRMYETDNDCKLTKKGLYKVANWFILNRNLANIFVSDDKDTINKLYSHIWAPEEWYYLTYIYKNNLQSQIIVRDWNNLTTFTNWGQSCYMFNRSNTPKILKNFRTIFSNELKYLINSPHLFARKFNPVHMNFKLLIDTFNSASKPPAA